MNPLLIQLFLISAFNLACDVSLKVAVGVYQELRTLPLNIKSWSDHLTNAEDISADLYFSLREMNKSAVGGKLSSKYLFNALRDADLSSHLRAFEEYVFDHNEQDDIAAIVSDIIENRRNQIEEYNPVSALITQYTMRCHLCSLMKAKCSEDYDLYVFMRSDIILGSNVWTAVSSAFPAFSMKNLSSWPENAVWVPLFDWEEHLGGCNDRFMIMAAAAFVQYCDGLRSKLLSLISDGLLLVGESLHGHILSNISQPIGIPVCYGVARRLDCSWTRYGNDACESLGLPSVQDQYGDSYFHRFAYSKHCVSR